MKRLLFFSCCILASSCAIAATITGKILDPAQAPVNGARVAVLRNNSVRPYAASFSKPYS